LFLCVDGVVGSIYLAPRDRRLAGGFFLMTLLLEL